MYSLQGRAIPPAVALPRAAKPPGMRNRQTAYAEKTKESELSTNAQANPNRATANPASMVPAVSVAHWVVWVSELAVCSSSLLAMAGKIAARPLLKKGETNISRPLSVYSSQADGCRTVTMNANA